MSRYFRGWGRGSGLFNCIRMFPNIQNYSRGVAKLFASRCFNNSNEYSVLGNSVRLGIEPLEFDLQTIGAWLGSMPNARSINLD